LQDLVCIIAQAGIEIFPAVCLHDRVDDGRAVLAQPPSSPAESRRQSVEGPSAVSGGRWTDSVFTATDARIGLHCLIIAAVPPSSGRRKHGQLHASRVQAARFAGYLYQQIPVSLAGWRKES